MGVPLAAVVALAAAAVSVRTNKGIVVPGAGASAEPLVVAHGAATVEADVAPRAQVTIDAGGRAFGPFAADAGCSASATRRRSPRPAARRR